MLECGNAIDPNIAALRAAAALAPTQPQVWRRLGDRLLAAGDASAAGDAYLEHVRHSVHDPALMHAAAALAANRIPEAEARLRAQLREAPTDIVAIRMLAELAVRIDRVEDAENLLARCLELAPGFREARHNYAIVLHRANKPVEAIAALEGLLRDEPRNPQYRNLKAAVLCRIGEYAPAIAIYAELLREHPQQVPAWLSYGHALKTEGETERAITAYRECIALDPGFGEAYWSLANLKTFRFGDAEIAAMRTALADPKSGDDEADKERRLHLDFALGKALEDRADYAASFAHYASGNALRLQLAPYHADDTSARLARAKATYTPEFFARRQGTGSPSVEPIFIVGLPRAGSTLIEQILSSHSQVEGTMELPELTTITRALRRASASREPGAYHDALARMDAGELRALGEEYLARSAKHRKLGRPYFIDKMPNNFAHAGLIHLILPNAKIIDARRHPLACGWSCFRQHFARGQNFAYRLTDIGRYYRDYADLMRHFDTVLPGRMHRVVYENMVADTECEVRALLDYCGLPFEDGTLRFFENDRPVRTASSEQVRQPIYKAGVDHWRNYEPWLNPLKEALGTDLTPPV
ncbi:MAG: sulfotransferase [Rudaea sp.]|uniref:tetratricopeptide repeat-containing sulfotransferase family protein n=1 Tax=unclassified Rudaea TaxID=2627037 RepID=UPI0010F473FF|nr:MULTISPECIES: tetratricopeptide repeat-containing sulfotransferase family protein [unclassified Rudaea]MBN8886519.1 sulfotransferase [Rudaea sp.]